VDGGDAYEPLPRLDDMSVDLRACRSIRAAPDVTRTPRGRRSVGLAQWLSLIADEFRPPGAALSLHRSRGNFAAWSYTQIFVLSVRIRQRSLLRLRFCCRRRRGRTTSLSSALSLRHDAFACPALVRAQKKEKPRASLRERKGNRRIRVTQQGRLPRCLRCTAMYCDVLRFYTCGRKVHASRMRSQT
jgi:hypothetical protein